jgi:hypothetical protein
MAAIDPQARIRQLTTGPVLRTLSGCRRRIDLCGWDEIKLLLGYYHCGIEELDYRMWTGRRKPKIED